MKIERLTTEKLRELGACDGPCERFNEMFPDGAELTAANMLKWCKSEKNRGGIIWLAYKLLGFTKEIQLHHKTRDIVYDRNYKPPPSITDMKFNEQYCLLVAEAMEAE